MKILFGIQGTGNGHVSRAREIIPELKKRGKVDVLISGWQYDINIDHPIKYRFKGLGFTFGKNGDINFYDTFIKSNPYLFFKNVFKLPIKKYDIIISDFEPITSWACKLRGKACYGLSHQSAVLDPAFPKPRKYNMLSRLILKHYAPFSKNIGLHFKATGDNILTPVINSEIRKLLAVKNKHYTVYLPSYDDHTLIEILTCFQDTAWEVFSKHCKDELKVRNVLIRPISRQDYLKSLSTSTGALCGAGFEGPAEALFLRKKLMVIPMKSQYEQQCNALALKSMGVPFIPEFSSRYIHKIDHWLKSDKIVNVNYPDHSALVIDKLFQYYYENDKTKNVWESDYYLYKIFHNSMSRSMVSKNEN